MATALSPQLVYGGIPHSDTKQPDPVEIIRLLNSFQAAIGAATGGMIAFADKATLDADLAHDAGTVALVYGDATAANNTVYVKSGASGAGSWSAVPDLAQKYLILTNTDSGDGNAITLSSTLALPSGAYGGKFMSHVIDANGAGGVTIAINGGTAKALLTNAGNAIGDGYLTAGMIIEFVDDGTNYRLTSDTASAAIQAACEAAQAAAETAQGLSEDAQSHAEEWANKAEDQLVSIAAGGDFVDDYSAMHFAKKTAADRAVTVAAKDTAVAASEASGDINFYDTYADANSALGGLSEGDLVEIAEDENEDGHRTRYRVESAALVFKFSLTKLEDIYGSGNGDFRGVAAGEQLAIAARRPRKLYSRLYAAATANTAVRILSIGDSLALRAANNFIDVLEKRLGSSTTGGPNTTGNTVAGDAGGYLTQINGVSVTAVTGDYATWPTGVYSEFADGGSADYTRFGANPYFTKVQVFYVTESGAGAISLKVDGVEVATADADGSDGVALLEYSQSYAQESVHIDVSGGSVKILQVHVETGLMGVEWRFTSFFLGGWAIATGFANAQARSNFQDFLDLIDVDLVTFEMDDNFVAGNSAATAFEQLETILNTALPYADKLIIGSTPRASDDAGKIASSAYLRSRVAANSTSWLFFDSYHLLGSYADQVAIFGSDDGVHPVNGAQAFKAEQILAQFGLPISSLGFCPNPVNDRSRASKLGADTEFGNSAFKAKLLDDDSSGYDWMLSVGRSVAFYGEYNDTLIARFSSNTAVAPNILPAYFTWGAPGEPYTVNITESVYHNSLVFADSSNDSGRMNVRVGFLSVGSFTKAELNAMSPNTMAGWVCFCSDANGGAGLVVSNGGGGASGWKRVDDNSVNATT